LSTGHWLIMDGDQRAIQRFARDGSHVGAFAAARVSRMAVSLTDEVAALSRDEREIVLFTADGQPAGRIPLRTTGYDLRNAVDLAYDEFGHLYVLSREALAVFSPYPAPASGASGTVPAAASPTRTYRQLTVFAAERTAGGFDRAVAFVIDPAGGALIYDDRAQRILVYR
jgi:hypothetical protein